MSFWFYILYKSLERCFTICSIYWNYIQEKNNKCFGEEKLLPKRLSLKETTLLHFKLTLNDFILSTQQKQQIHLLLLLFFRLESLHFSSIKVQCQQFRWFCRKEFPVSYLKTTLASIIFFKRTKPECILFNRKYKQCIICERHTILIITISKNHLKF